MIVLDRGYGPEEFPDYKGELEMKNLSKPKKRIYAPAALAVGVIIVAVVGLIAIGFYIGSQGDQHSRVGGGLIDGYKSAQSVDYEEVKQALHQGRIDG